MCAHLWMCVSECVYVCKHACMGMFGLMVREGAAGDSAQPIVRFEFFMIFPLIHKILPSPFLCSVSLLYLKALGTNSNSGSIEPFLPGLKTGFFSGRTPYTAAAFSPNLRKYPHEGAMPSLTASSSQAKALLASLTASGLSAEALLLSSTLRHHRLLREQRASSLPPPSSQSSSSSPTPPASSSSSSPSSPTTLTPSLSPSSPTPFSSLALSSAVLKRSACSLDSSVLNNPVSKDLTPGNSK